MEMVVHPRARTHEHMQRLGHRWEHTETMADGRPFVKIMRWMCEERRIKKEKEEEEENTKLTPTHEMKRKEKKKWNESKRAHTRCEMRA